MSGPKTHVAVVDDDESFARALGRMLRASGFEVLVFGSADQFLRDATPAAVDCALLDIHLGDVSGLDLRRHMLALGWTCPVIFVTAHDEVAIREEAERVGCAAYLRKPVAGGALVEAIRRAVRHAPLIP